MRELLPLFIKPSHYLGNEPGAVRKDPQAVAARLALAFPDLYEIGMSYLGQAILYDSVNRRPELWAERVFMPSAEVGRVLQEHHTALATLESDTPLDQMDAIGFSLTHELCYTNVLHMLHLAGLPVRAEDRRNSWPLVLAGGGCVYAAEPMAPFLDLMVLGDGEDILPDILLRLAEAKKSGQGKTAFLASLAGQPGIYLPDRPSPVRRHAVPDLNKTAYPLSPATPFEAVHERYVLEIARGCTRGCRFCQAGMIYRPVRERSLDRLEELAVQGLDRTGHTEISFLSLSAGDFSDLPGLFQRCEPFCRQRQISISLPSLRVGSVDESVMAQVAGIRRTGATLAPEAGSERMRQVINKGITERDLLDQALTLSRLGWRNVKLYFMLGLPGETEQDLKAILDLCLKVAWVTGHKSSRFQVTAAVSTFVPKAHTPFQWEGQLTLDETRQSLDYLQQIFKPYKFLKLKWHKPEMSFLEGIFARGDRRLAEVVEKAWRKGALLCSWTDHLTLAPWLEAMEECGLDPSEYLRPRALDTPLPWDHLNCGVSREFLIEERDRAFRLEATPDCRYAACSACGACSGPLKPVLNTRPASPDQTAQPAIHEPSAGRPEPPDRTELAHKAGHVRLAYQKIGPAAYLSQLELQTVFDRCLRQAGFLLSFSQGFHPAPLMSFGRALPVGVASLDEYMDIYLRKYMAPADILQILAPLLPAGLELREVLELPMGKSFPESVREDFALDLLAPAEQLGQLRERWEAFAQADAYLVEKPGKGQVTPRDIRPFFQNIDLSAWPRLTFSLDWSQGYMNPLFMVTTITAWPDKAALRLTKLKQYLLDQSQSGGQVNGASGGRGN